MKRRQKENDKVNRFGFPAEYSGGLWSIYDAIAGLGVVAVKLGGLFHTKLGAAVRGRAGGVKRWQIKILDERPSILIHTASRGEFESVCPLIEGLLKENSYRVAVSFSSPSVEKAVQSYEGLWASGYLPFDQLGEQLRFLSRLEPSLILVAKHDIWPNMIRAAAMLQIPYIIINANFHSRTKRRLPLVGSFNRKFFSLVSEIWTISDDDAARVKPLLSRSVQLKVIGDTRYDRAIQRAVAAKAKFAGLKTAFGQGPVIVAGSTWEPDERIVFPAFAEFKKSCPSAKLLIAPHEPGENALLRCRKACTDNNLNLMLHSEWHGKSIVPDVHYLDAMGLLADIYSVGWAAVVGGGFGVGVHSVLEPAAYDLPVAFGPNRHVSHEAGLLINSGGGILLTDAKSLAALWGKWRDNPLSYSEAVTAAHTVVASRAGATDRVRKLLEPYLRR